MRPAPTTVLRGLLATAAMLVVACGSDTPHVQQAVASPLTEGSVGFKQTGDAAAAIDRSSITYRLDDARLLVVTLNLRSTATTAQTIGVRASLYDKSGKLIGDATGGELNVQPNATVQVILSGPHPNGTVASATFEVHQGVSTTP
jgi:hypothetical protein